MEVFFLNKKKFLFKIFDSVSTSAYYKEREKKK